MSAGPAALWRSLLFVPANVERFIAAAPAAGADGIELDLEDAVAPGEKAAARANLRSAAAAVARGGAHVVVRVNRSLSLAVQDIAAAVGPNVGTLALPKIMGADHVRLLAEVVGDAERRQGLDVGTTRLIVMIETAEAALRVREIAAAHPRVIGVTLGTEDLATDLAVDPAAAMLDAHHATLVAAAVAARVVPLGLVGSIAQFRDLAAFDALAKRSREFGYRGAACIHPRQVAILNAAFTPAAGDVERARQIVAAYDAAHAGGQGAIALDGRMIDIPVAERARALIASYEATLSHPAR